MNLKARLSRLERAARDILPEGQIEMIVCSQAEEGPAARPAGEYPNVDGRVVDVVFEGLEPDPAVLERLEARLSPWGVVLVCVPKKPMASSKIQE